MLLLNLGSGMSFPLIIKVLLWYSIFSPVLCR